MKKHKPLGDWTNFEKTFLAFGILTAIATTIGFHGDLVNLLYVISYFVTALLMAKGKVACYFIGFFSTFFYAFVSYNQGYYGELLITLFLTLPIMIVGIISWLRHQNKEEKVVIINSLSKKEIAIAFILQIPLYAIYYLILKQFNTDMLILSALSIVTSVLASYFEARRSELSLWCYIANDLVIITLWLIPVIAGDTALVSVLVGPILLLMNDTYGAYNWRHMKQKQALADKAKNLQ